MNEEELQQGAQPQPAEENTNEMEQTGTLTLADGSDTGVSVDSGAQADALDPNGFAEIDFTQGNYKNFEEIPQKISQKVLMISKTILPLIDVALIELLGNNKEYSRVSFQSDFTLTANEPTFTVNLKYLIEKWIGNDIKEEYIQQDAKYVLDRINVIQGVTFTQCKIDTNDGSLSISLNF